MRIYSHVRIGQRWPVITVDKVVEDMVAASPRTVPPWACEILRAAVETWGLDSFRVAFRRSRKRTGTAGSVSANGEDIAILYGSDARDRQGTFLHELAHVIQGQTEYLGYLDDSRAHGHRFQAIFADVIQRFPHYAKAVKHSYRLRGQSPSTYVTAALDRFA